MFIESNHCQENVSSLVKSWFNSENTTGREENLIEPLTYRNLSLIEQVFFKTNDIAATSQRFSKNFILFHSREYKKNIINSFKKMIITLLDLLSIIYNLITLFLLIYVN